LKFEIDIRNLTNPIRLMKHVEEITRFIRDSGGEGEAKAFDYIERCVQDWGITYTRMTHPAYISLPGNAALTLTAEDGECISLKCITPAMGASTGSAGVTAHVQREVASNPEGFRSGNILFMNGLATPAGTLRAQHMGASAVIFNNGSECHEMTVSNVWGSPSDSMKHLLPKLPVVSIEESDAKLLNDWINSKKFTATIHTEVLAEWRPIPLLVAEIQAEPAEMDFILFSGHVDSWHYGAMDNASANAVQLETLRIFQSQREHLKRNLRVAFWSGHSHGRYAGSQWYADHHWQELYDHAVLHMYVDSVGGKGASVLTEAWCMPELHQVAYDSLKKQTGEEFRGARFGRGGDQSFYGIGVSALYMCMSEQPNDGDTVSPLTQLFGGSGKTAGLGWWWHHLEDTIDKLDPDFLYRDASIYLLSLERLLTSSVLPFDFSRTLEEIYADLDFWANKAGRLFDVSEVIALLESVKMAYTRWTEQRDALSSSEQNDMLKKLSRQLVPVSFSPGNLYEHGLAAYYPPIPALMLIDRLVATEPGTGEFYELWVDLQRKKNFLIHHLMEALKLLND
jgi:hypothetical protein